MHLFDMPIDGSAPPRRISSEVVGWPLLLSNDETRAAALGTNDRVMLLSLEGEKSQTVPGCAGGDVPIGFTPDDSALWIFRRGRISVTIERVDIASGARTSWHTIQPGDPAGILDIFPIHITSDGQTYAYGYRRFLSDLYVVTGLI